MTFRGIGLAVIILCLLTLVALIAPTIWEELRQVMQDFFEWLINPFGTPTERRL